MKQKGKKYTWAHIIVLATVCMIIFFINNQSRYPDREEMQNMVTARQAVAEGSWLYPLVHEGIKTNRSPLSIWIFSQVEKCSPDDIGLQRALAGVAACMFVLFFYLLVRDLFDYENLAWLSSLVLCTCYGLIDIGRSVSGDIYGYAFMLGAVYLFCSTLKENKATSFSALLSGLFAGISFLCCGAHLFVCMVLPFLISFFIFCRPFAGGRWRQVLMVVISMLLVIGLWLIILYSFSPNLSWIGCLALWPPYRMQSWHDAVRFGLDWGVWILMLLTALLYPLWQKRTDNMSSYLWAITWFVLSLIALLTYPAANRHYLLLLLLPGSYLVALLLDSWQSMLHHSSGELFIRLYHINTYIISAALLLMPIIGYWVVYRAGYMDSYHYLLFSSLLVGISAYLFYMSWRGEPAFFVYGVVVAFSLFLAFISPYFGNVINNPDYRSVSDMRQSKEWGSYAVYGSKNESLALEVLYEFRKTVPAIDLTDSTAISKALPFVLVTGSDNIPVALRRKVKVSQETEYDNNRVTKDSPNYRADLVTHCFLLQHK